QDISSIKNNHSFTWPGGDVENFDTAISYKVASADGEAEITIGYGYRVTYGTKRRRVVVWIDNYPYAEFMGADDFEVTGEVLSEIRIWDDENDSKRMCRYAVDIIPERYSMFRAGSLKHRVTGDGVHDAWAVIANVADHKCMSALAAMRKYETEE
ncbi:MAG: hypothetical protein SRB2_02746, partial [Desulfobacteraceae bacterium Eth-SRB2]